MEQPRRAAFTAGAARKRSALVLESEHDSESDDLSWHAGSGDDADDSALEYSEGQSGSEDDNSESEAGGAPGRAYDRARASDAANDADASNDSDSDGTAPAADQHTVNLAILKELKAMNRKLDNMPAAGPAPYGPAPAAAGAPAVPPAAPAAPRRSAPPARPR